MISSMWVINHIRCTSQIRKYKTWYNPSGYLAEKSEISSHFLQDTNAKENGIEWRGEIRKSLRKTRSNYQSTCVKQNFNVDE